MVGWHNCLRNPPSVCLMCWLDVVLRSVGSHLFHVIQPGRSCVGVATRWRVGPGAGGVVDCEVWCFSIASHMPSTSLFATVTVCLLRPLASFLCHSRGMPSLPSRQHPSCSLKMSHSCTCRSFSRTGLTELAWPTSSAPYVPTSDELAWLAQQVREHYHCPRCLAHAVSITPTVLGAHSQTAGDRDRPTPSCALHVRSCCRRAVTRHGQGQARAQ